jgi:hypothetical protein
MSHLGQRQTSGAFFVMSVYPSLNTGRRAEITSRPLSANSRHMKGALRNGVSDRYQATANGFQLTRATIFVAKEETRNGSSRMQRVFQQRRQRNDFEPLNPCPNKGSGSLSVKSFGARLWLFCTRFVHPNFLNGMFTILSRRVG